MTHEKFEALVQRLEPFARRSPGQYRMRVGLLAALGYAYLLFMLGLTAALIGGLIWLAVTGHAGILLVKLGIPLLVVAGLILRSLWVTLPPPDGTELARADAPRLFAMLDELSDRLKAPRFHHVQLTGDFNAGIVQIPRLGVFGWQRNYLLLGLPLMEATSPDQFRAVIAHEMGHLSGNHSRFSGWIYRIRQTWERLLVSLQRRRHIALWLFVPFFGWYAPFFSAYSFVLARTDEYVADRCAAEVAGRETAAEALVRVQLAAHYLEDRFWPEVAEQAQRSAEPPAALYASMFRGLREGMAPDDARRWLWLAFAEKTGVDDTHPSLKDRLAALDCPTDPEAMSVPAPPTESAAQHYLGALAAAQQEQLDIQWQRQVAPQWQEHHKEALDEQHALAELEKKSEEGPLSDDDQWERARLTANLRGAAALPLLSEFTQAHPDHALAAFALGALLLNENNENGLAHLERAMALDSEGILPACEAAYGFLRQHGREAEASQYRARAEKHLELLAQAQTERDELKRRDTFLEHGLSNEELGTLRARLSGHALVRKAYLARKQVVHFPEKPVWVLGILLHKPFLGVDDAKKAALVRQIKTELTMPGETLIVLLEEQFAWAEGALGKVPGALIFQR